jgi:purine nucleosidase
LRPCPSRRLFLHASRYPSSSIPIRGSTTSYGNTTVEHAYRNCVEILRRVGRRLTLGVSARRPLKRALAVALETHGPTGLGLAAVPPAGVILDFVKPLDRLLADQTEPVTLVTLGPVTGLALALRRDPAVVRRTVKRHLAMIGNLRAAGNTTRYAEFNAWCDPEALAEVLRAELPTELVGLARADDELERWLHAALRFYLDFHREHEKLDGCVINDVLPIAELVSPDTLSFEPLRLAVDVEDGEPRGRTRVDPNGARVRMATGVRADAAHRLLVERVLTTLAPAAAGRER